jgi:hypothetical protein
MHSYPYIYGSHYEYAWGVELKVLTFLNSLPYFELYTSSQFIETFMLTKSPVFWDIASCSSLKVNTALYPRRQGSS